MLRFNLAVVAIAMFSIQLFSCAEFKQAGRDIGHGTRDATRAIGHSTRDAVKAIGEESRDIYNKVKKDVHEATAD